MSTKSKNANALMSSFTRQTSLERIKLLADSKETQTLKEPIRVIDTANDVSVLRTEVRENTTSKEVAGYERFQAAKTYKIGDRIALPLDLVLENPNNPRFFFFDSSMQSLIASLAKHNQLTTVQVYPADAAGQFMLKSGSRRTRGLRFLNRSTVNVEVVSVPANLLVEYKEARDINIEQRSQSHFDDGIRFSQFLEQKIARDQQHLAELLGIPEAELSKCLSVAALPLPVQATMAEFIENFGSTSAYAIYRYWAKCGKDEARTHRLVQRVIQNKLSSRQLETIVKDQTSAVPSKKRDRALSRAEVSGKGKGELKAFEGKITLELSDLPDESRDVLFRKIILVFKEAGLEVETASFGPGFDQQP